MKDEFYYRGAYRKERWWWPFPIAHRVRGSGSVVLGRVVYQREKGSIIRRVHRIFTRIHEAKLAVMYRVIPKHQYHIVRTDLEPGYYDQDTRILHACMSCLCTYVEIECGGAGQLTEFSGELRKESAAGAHEPHEGAIDGQASRQDESVAIYRWWKIERPRDQARERELLRTLYGNGRKVFTEKSVMDGQMVELVPVKRDESERALHKEFRALQRKIATDEDEMLIRLMKIRRSLWT